MEDQSLRFELPAMNIEGNNYIVLSKKKWKLEEIEGLYILTKIEDF